MLDAPLVIVISSPAQVASLFIGVDLKSKKFRHPKSSLPNFQSGLNKRDKWRALLAYTQLPVFFASSK
jgi:hypothetical protein